MAQHVSNFFCRLKSLWNYLAAAATWVTSVVGGFLLPPPGVVFEASEKQVLHRFAAFVTAVVVGLLAVPLLRWSKRRHVWRWWLLAIISFFMALTAFVGYQALWDKWTSVFGSHTVLIGTDSDFTVRAKEFFATNHNYELPGDRIKAFGGVPEEVWHHEALSRHYSILVAFYVMTLPMFAIALFSVLQALYCNSRRN